MKKLKFVFKDILYPASFAFTLYVFAVYLLAYMGKNEITGSIVAPKLLIIGYVYFIITALVTKIFRTSLSNAVKLLIHFLGLFVPLVAALAVLGNGILSGTSIAVLLALFGIIYLIIALPILLIKRARNKVSNETEKYDSQFN